VCVCVCVCWVQYFNQILTVVLESLDDPNSSIRELSLSLIFEMLSNQVPSPQCSMMSSSVDFSFKLISCPSTCLHSAMQYKEEEKDPLVMSFHMDVSPFVYPDL
jgi:hypothetical protein